MRFAKSNKTSSPNRTRAGTAAAKATPTTLPPAAFVAPDLAVTSCACGGGCPRCQKKLPIQAKLEVSQPGDPYEKEADRVADQVVRMPEPAADAPSPSAPRIQRLCRGCEEELKRQPLEEEEESPVAKTDPGTVPEVGAEVETAIQTLPGRGKPLPDAVRHFMEPRFNANFDAVRVHNDAGAHDLARSVNAQAFTVGRHIVFGAGHYDQSNDRGRRLLAHELTHVVQQSTLRGSGRGPSIANQPPAFVARAVYRQPNPSAVNVGSAPEGPPASSVQHAALRLSTSEMRGNTRVDAAIELTRRAIIHATDTPPDSNRALDILHKVEFFLAPFVDDANIRKYYSGFSAIQVQIIATDGLSAVKTLQAQIRIGLNSSPRGRNGGLWDYYFTQLAIARDYLVILSGEVPKTIAQMTVDEKIGLAVSRAIYKLPGEVGERLKELLSPASLAMLVGFTAAYVVSQTTPIGWVADIIVAGLIAATVLMVGQEAIDIVKLLLHFVDKSAGAKSDDDLDEAGDALAQAISKAGVDIVLAILLHRAAKAANLKPSGPRSPGLVEVLKTTGEKITTRLRTPATSGWYVTPDGTQIWVPDTADPGAMNLESRSATGGSGGRSGAGGEPGRQSMANEPAAKESLSQKPAAAGTDPLQGIRTALERIIEKIADAREEIGREAKNITAAELDEWALRQRIKNTPASDPSRAQMLEDLKAKQDRIAELKARQQHRTALHDQDVATRVRLQDALNAKTYARPGFTEAERAKIWEQALKDGGGKVNSPSGKEIKPGDPWEVGHKPKYEFWKHVRSAAERGITREQFLRECKDLGQYRPETPGDNSSHLYEDKTDAYLGP